MLVMRQKRKHVHKTLRENTQALEKGLLNKEVAGKYNVPKNTIPTQVKYKDKILSSLEE